MTEQELTAPEENLRILATACKDGADAQTRAYLQTAIRTLSRGYLTLLAEREALQSQLEKAKSDAYDDGYRDALENTEGD